MSFEQILAVIGVVIVIGAFAFTVARKLPKRIRRSHYVRKWREIQKMCAHKDDWGHAIIHADMLLDEILTKKKVLGKTMGERMVSVQHNFSAHDAVWNAHKLANSVRQNTELKISQAKVKNALIAYGQALKDLGAL